MTLANVIEEIITERKEINKGFHIARLCQESQTSFVSVLGGTCFAVATQNMILV